MIILLAGCGAKNAAKNKKPGDDSYFNEDGYLKGLGKAYQGSKEKINNSVEMENKKLQDALDAGN